MWSVSHSHHQGDCWGNDQTNVEPTSYLKVNTFLCYNLNQSDFSESATKYAEKCICSVVLGDDIVCRLGLTQIFDMKTRVFQIIRDCDDSKVGLNVLDTIYLTKSELWTLFQNFNIYSAINWIFSGWSVGKLVRTNSKQTFGQKTCNPSRWWPTFLARRWCSIQRSGKIPGKYIYLFFFFYYFHIENKLWPIFKFWSTKR